MPETRTNWAAVTFGLSLSFLAAFQLFKLPPVLPVLLEAYRYDLALAGGFMSVYALAGLGLSLAIGQLLARRGMAPAILMGLAVMLAGNGLALFRPDQGLVMLAARALEGIGFAVLAIAGPLLANSGASRSHLPLVIGLTAAWIPAGQLTAGLLTPGALALQGWQSLWVLAGGLTVLLALWTLSLANAGAFATTSNGWRPAQVSTNEASSVSANALLWFGAAIFMLWSGQFFAFMTWLPQVLLEDHGLSVTLSLAGYLLPVAVLLVFNLITGQLLRLGVPLGPLMTAAIVLQAAIWWLHPWVKSDGAGIALLVAYGVGAGITPTCLFALPSALARPEQAASAFGILMTGRNIGVLCGPILLAQAFKMAGSWTISAPVFGGITVLAAAIAGALALRLGR